MSPEPVNAIDVDPHGFYSVTAACRILRISRPTMYARIDTVRRDAFGRIPGYEVLRLAGVDWQAKQVRESPEAVRKRIRDLV
jgi:hypothetical protein